MIPGAFANLPRGLGERGLSGCRGEYRGVEARVQDTEELRRLNNPPGLGRSYPDNFGYFSWLYCMMSCQPRPLLSESRKLILDSSSRGSGYQNRISRHHLWRTLTAYARASPPVGFQGALSSIRVILESAIERRNSGEVRPSVTMAASETNK